MNSPDKLPQLSEHVEELESLLFDWEAETLDADGVERFREILRSDRAARAWFAQHQMISAALKLEGDAGLLPSERSNADETAEGSLASRKPETLASDSAQQTQVTASLADASGYQAAETLGRDTSRSRKWIWAFAAAAVFICVQAGRILYLESAAVNGDTDNMNGVVATERDQSQEATSRGIALVTRLVDVAWDSDQPAMDVGDALTPGRLAIEDGFAQIEFFCGATVVIEGPAELELVSSTLAKVLSGRLRAQVPPAVRGFSLEVDGMKVVDLGTEFGVAVSSTGADVQVFDGEVEVHSASAEKQSLTTGQALVRDNAGQFESKEITPDQFVDIASLESQALEQQTTKYQRWQNHSNTLRRDSRLIAYYAFDDARQWNRRLHSSLQPTNAELDGAIVGARPVVGRWPAKQSLEFKRPGDRVRVNIPGEFGSLTFCCWVKIDSLDRWFNSLFLTDGYNQGEPHWQILDSGQLYFSVRPRKQDEPGPRDQKVLSPPFWTPSMSGKWLHLATSYDSQTGRTTHYLNSDLLHTEIIPEDRLARSTRIGPASIGNWASPTQPGDEFAIRNLNGQIDEFAVFNVALTHDEIAEIYEHGKP